MSLNIDFFKIKNDKVASPGRILISEPFLSDTYFKRAVVLLTEHSDEGSVGFVLNKPVDLHIQDVIQDFPEVDTGISIGGPVNTNTVHFVHTLGEFIPESVHVYANIYWGGDFDTLKSLIIAGKVGVKQVRFFLGYSGWAPKQLEGEIGENAWLVGELDPAMIMESDQINFWNDVLKRMNNKYQVWANFPENPGMN